MLLPLPLFVFVFFTLLSKMSNSSNPVLIASVMPDNTITYDEKELVAVLAAKKETLMREETEYRKKELKRETDERIDRENKARADVERANRAEEKRRAETHAAEEERKMKLFRAAYPAIVREEERVANEERERAAMERDRELHQQAMERDAASRRKIAERASEAQVKLSLEAYENRRWKDNIRAWGTACIGLGVGLYAFSYL